jgi:hypothetical protein
VQAAFKPSRRNLKEGWQIAFSALPAGERLPFANRKCSSAPREPGPSKILLKTAQKRISCSKVVGEETLEDESQIHFTNSSMIHRQGYTVASVDAREQPCIEIIEDVAEDTGILQGRIQVTVPGAETTAGKIDEFEIEKNGSLQTSVDIGKLWLRAPFRHVYVESFMSTTYQSGKSIRVAVCRARLVDNCKPHLDASVGFGGTCAP